MTYQKIIFNSLTRHPCHCQKRNESILVLAEKWKHFYFLFNDENWNYCFKNFSLLSSVPWWFLWVEIKIIETFRLTWFIIIFIRWEKNCYSIKCLEIFDNLFWRRMRMFGNEIRGFDFNVWKKFYRTCLNKFETLLHKFVFILFGLFRSQDHEREQL